MKARTLFLLAFLFLCQSIWSQVAVLSGKVLDENGDPLPFASVYLENSTYGVSSDGKGRYRLPLYSLPAEIGFSYVGYQTYTKTFDDIEGEHLFDIQLKLGAELMEAEIVGDTRDRAKMIMQEVRDRRRDYKNALGSYSSDAYMKLKLEREVVDTTASDSLDLSSKEGVEKLIKENMVLSESIAKIDFERPQRYKENILALRDYTDREVPFVGKSINLSISVGEEDIAPVRRRSKNPYLMWESLQDADFDFYDNLIHFEKIAQKPFLSPIAATGGLAYRYDYEGSFIEDNVRIHWINVTPLNPTEPLFSGTLFIEDESFALVGVDLEVNPLSLQFCDRFRIIQNYEEVEDGIYVPVRREMNYTLKDGRDKVLGKVLVNQSEFEVNPAFPFGHFSGEVKRFEVSDFDQADSILQAKRPLQLDPSEQVFIQKADSITDYLNSDEFFAKEDSAFNKINWWSPLIGVGHRNRIKGTEWYVEGLLGQINPVGIGGYRHRLPGRWQKTLANDDLIEIDGFVDYGFRNRDVKGRIGAGWTYRPDKAMRTYVRAGDFYEMINNYASIEQIFSRSNFSRNQTVFVSQRMELFNGLYGELAFDYADQIPLKDITFANWSNELFGELNEPSDFDRYTKTEVRLELKWRINQKYYWYRGRKEVIGSDYPELRFIYRKGINGMFNSEVDFDYLELTADHELSLARLGDMHWRASMGSFVNQKSLRLLEHRYFRGSDRFFFSDPTRSFQLLGPTLSTADAYFQANVMHHFNGTILGKVPLFNRMKLQLAAGGGTLLLPGEEFRHAEVFAGLERTFRIKEELFRLSVYAVTSDNNLQAADYTIKFGINFFNTFTNKWEY